MNHQVTENNNRDVFYHQVTKNTKNNDVVFLGGLVVETLGGLVVN